MRVLGDKTHEARELHLMQHVDPALCPVYMLAMYLFLKYTLQREQMPNPFTQWQQW